LQAQELLGIKRFSDVLAVLQNSTATGATGALVWRFRAMAYRGLGDTKRARSCVETAIAMDPEDYLVFVSASLIFHDAKDFRGQLQAASTAVRLGPNRSICWSMYAVALADSGQGKSQQAADAVRRAIELDPTSAEPYINGSVVEIAAKRYDNATAYLMKALEIDPTSVAAQNNLAKVRLNSRRFLGVTDAAQGFANVSGLDPSSSLGRSNLTQTALVLVASTSQIQFLAVLVGYWLRSADHSSAFRLLFAVLWLGPMAYLAYLWRKMSPEVRGFMSRAALRPPVLWLSLPQTIAWLVFLIGIILNEPKPWFGIAVFTLAVVRISTAVWSSRRRARLQRQAKRR
jgi:Tfp pilus assembly protein PilF